MAKAFKCDRCGGYYDEDVDNVKFVVADLDENQLLDFCVPCAIALKDWMSLPERIKRKDLDDFRDVITEAKRPVGRPKKVDVESLTAKAEEAKKKEKLDNVLDKMAEKRGDYE